jgi:hypothetical protein
MSLSSLAGRCLVLLTNTLLDEKAFNTSRYVLNFDFEIGDDLLLVLDLFLMI